MFYTIGIEICYDDVNLPDKEETYGITSDIKMVKKVVKEILNKLDIQCYDTNEFNKKWFKKNLKDLRYDNYRLVSNIARNDKSIVRLVIKSFRLDDFHKLEDY